MSNEKVEQLRDISIKDLLGVRENYKAKQMIRCPMPNHNDSTPSFLIDEKNAYHCFGCDAKGLGAISFVMEVEGIDFKEACQELEKLSTG